MAIRIGFCGTGGIAQMHMRNYQRLEGANVVGMFDVAADKAAAAAHLFEGCLVYDSLQNMLGTANLDALYVCLPPFAHEKQELLAASAGVNLFIEKPITITTEKAIEINEAINKAGVIAAVGYNWRWLDTTDKAKALLAEHKIALALGYWLGGMPGVSWWRRKDQSGGQIVEQTTHIFDLARYLLGEVKQVYTSSYKGLMQDIEHYNTEDASIVTLEFASGTIGMITSTCLLPSGVGKVGLDMIGRDIRIEEDPRTLTVYQAGQRTIYDAQVDPYYLEDKAFIAAVANKDPSGLRSTYKDALQTHYVTMAANRCLENH